MTFGLSEALQRSESQRSKHLSLHMPARRSKECRLRKYLVRRRQIRKSQGHQVRRLSRRRRSLSVRLCRILDVMLCFASNLLPRKIAPQFVPAAAMCECEETAHLTGDKKSGLRKRYSRVRFGVRRITRSRDFNTTPTISNRVW